MDVSAAEKVPFSIKVRTESTRVILRLLAEYEIRSTFFVLGWVAEREPKLVRDIAEAGHEVACHGYSHILPMQLTPVQFRDDILRARHVLQEVSGREIIGYRAPSFSIDRERLAILEECGFRYDSSYHPFAIHDRYGHLGDLGGPVMPGVYRLSDQMVELGLPVERVGLLPLPVSGGGYFRLYPAALFRSLVRRAIVRCRMGNPYSCLPAGRVKSHHSFNLQTCATPSRIR